MNRSPTSMYLGKPGGLKPFANFFAWYVGKLFDHPYSGVPPIIVSGVGRSGTTALRLSMGEHPNIVYNQSENNVLMDMLATGLHNCTYPSRKASMQMGQARYDKAFRNMILHLLYPRPRFSFILPKRWLALSDLDPRLAGYLQQLFPEVRIVYIVRNGIEVVSSRMAFEGFKDRPFEWQCEVWAKAEEMADWGQHQNNFFLIRHETLLTEETASQVFRTLWCWLGLNDEPRCLGALLRNSYHPTRLPGEKMTKGVNLRYRNQRWKQWTDEQRRTFVSHCSKAMQYFGYPILWVPEDHCTIRTDDL